MALLGQPDCHSGEPLKAVTCARKPLISTVANNVLTHGCGGINIAATRLNYQNDGDRASATPQGACTSHDGTSIGAKPNVGQSKDRLAFERPEQTGRWPANTVFSHLEDCRCAGVKKVKGIAGGDHSGTTETHEQVGGFGHDRHNIKRHNDTDGNETVANWVCVEGCPVRALDEQSGIVPTGTWNRQTDGAHPFGDAAGSDYDNWKSVKEPEGGASRFFKSVQESSMNQTIPEELLAYLTDLIDPSHITGDGGVIYIEDVEGLDLSEYDDASMHGVIAEGTPTEDQVKEMNRVLKPGGHVLLVAPDDQPTGHVGTCRLECGGFEVRDSILYVNSPDGFWYVPKAARSEREAGCAKLRKDDKKVGNDHPTVKPIAIMEALLNTVPKDGPAVDPFMGSGTTGVAALHTGHDFIGIEREEDYLRIADARVRHWDAVEWRGEQAVIESDIQSETESEAIDLSDLFGMGG